MTTKDRMINDYFDWLSNIVGELDKPKTASYRKLLMHLHDTDFIFSIPRDENRADDGMDLRYRFALDSGYGDDAFDYLDGRCSVLEMMIALSIRCEEDVMDDPGIGNRTAQWFWGMIANLGLNSMTDILYDRRYVDDVLTRFLNREYDPDGKGGLFRIKNCDQDLRKVEIWYQLCWYLDGIV